MIHINALVSCPHQNQIRTIARKFFRSEKIKNRSVSISLVGPAMIRKLNARYRRKNKITDVLSFPQEDPKLLGDIFICVSRARAQAREIGHSLSRELQYLTVHGLYHLLGYDHLKRRDAVKMRAKEKKLMGEVT